PTDTVIAAAAATQSAQASGATPAAAATTAPTTQATGLVVGMRAFDEAGAQMVGKAADIFSGRLPPGAGSQRLDMQALLMQIPKERRALWTASAGDLDSLLGSLPGPVSYVEYDLERWPQTPKSEQDNPVAAVQQAQQIAHAHGAQLLLTPTSY